MDLIPLKYRILKSKLQAHQSHLVFRYHQDAIYRVQIGVAVLMAVCAAISAANIGNSTGSYAFWKWCNIFITVAVAGAAPSIGKYFEESSYGFETTRWKHFCSEYEALLEDLEGGEDSEQCRVRFAELRRRDLAALKDGKHLRIIGLIERRAVDEWHRVNDIQKLEPESE